MGNQCGACLGISVKRTGLRKEYRARSLQKDLDDDRSCDTWQNRREALYQQQRAKIESKCSRAEPEVPVSFVSESWLGQSRIVAESQRVALEALLHERETGPAPWAGGPRLLLRGERHGGGEHCRPFPARTGPGQCFAGACLPARPVFDSAAINFV